MSEINDEQWHECSRIEPPEKGQLVSGQRRPDGSWAITGFHPPGSLRRDGNTAVLTIKGPPGQRAGLAQS